MQTKSKKQRQSVAAVLRDNTPPIRFLDLSDEEIDALAEKIDLIYRPEKNLSLQQDMISALAEVMGKDANLNGTRLAALASALLKTANATDPSGFVTPAFIRQQYGEGGKFYEYDWRGAEGQWPSEGAIRDTLKRAVMGWPGGRPKSGGRPEHRPPEGV